MGYGEWLHGEAVAVGTLMAAELSRRMGLLAQADVERIAALFRRAGIPVQGPVLPALRYLELMQHDKKVEGGRLRLVLIRRLGEAFVCDTAPAEEIIASIDAWTAHD